MNSAWRIKVQVSTSTTSPITAPENLEKPNGRGVFLMRQLADTCEFEELAASPSFASRTPSQPLLLSERLGTITFQFLNTPFRLAQRAAVRSWIQDCAKANGHDIGELNFLFTNDDEMLSLNRNT